MRPRSLFCPTQFPTGFNIELYVYTQGRHFGTGHLALIRVTQTTFMANTSDCS
jgi:hypothetical protein